MSVAIRRRNFLGALGLGAGATLLNPLLSRLVSEAHGQTNERYNLMVLTDGNGWGHQAMNRNSQILDTQVRSPSDWDLPAALAPLDFVRSRLTIARPLKNFSNSLHGSGWATLSATPPVGGGPGGVSLDRMVGLATGNQDAFPSIALGVGSRADRPPECTSSDGPRRPFPAISSPLRAFETFFGSGTAGGQDPSAALSREHSLLDGMIEDVERARNALASPERAKLEQLLDSYRTLEQSLAERRRIFEMRPPPPAPDASLDRTGLDPEVIRGHIDVIAQAMSFGLTHVAHLSIFGFDDHNAGWGAWGYGGDAHEDLSHLGGYDVDRADEAIHAITKYKAAELAHLYRSLEEATVGDDNLAERTVFVWVNSGGGKHHDGSAYHPIVLIGDAGGRLRTGQFLEIDGDKRSIADAYLAVAQALGVETDCFGDPEACRGPLPGLV